MVSPSSRNVSSRGDFTPDGNLHGRTVNSLGPSPEDDDVVELPALVFVLPVLRSSYALYTCMMTPTPSKSLT